MIDAKENNRDEHGSMTENDWLSESNEKTIVNSNGSLNRMAIWNERKNSDLKIKILNL